MADERQIAAWAFDISRQTVMIVLFVAGMFATSILAAPAAQAQTLTVLHSFTGGRDGANPAAGLTMDEGGNLYGTTEYGGAGNGTVFKLGHSGSGWTFSPLYSFQNGSDGAYPVARVIFGPDHTLYGTTQQGGETGYCTTGGCGTAFNLRPSPTACKTALCPWIEAIVHRFTSGGVFPESEVIFDAAGNIYGTAYAGGSFDPGGGGGCYPCGTVYQLTPSSGGWTESVLYTFQGYGRGGADGAGPIGGVIFDSAGNLYGTTADGGDCAYGTLFQLTASGGWAEHILHHFCSPGAGPAASMIADPSGNFYGTTEGSSPGQGNTNGSVFSLVSSNGSWVWQSLHTFPQTGGGPAAQVLRDSAGNLYGTTITGGSNPLGRCSADGCGRIFELAYSNGSYTYIELYDFTGGADGAAPYSNLVMDATGNLYGTTSGGGANGDGTVFEFTP